MALSFEKGSEERPKGHALLYFRSSSDLDEIWVTYVVILPVSVDVSKYVPPFLMTHVGEVGPMDLSAFAFPPAPEQLSNYQTLESLASARDDDILYGGAINPTDVPSAMMLVTDVVQQYSEQYSQKVGSPHLAEGVAGSYEDSDGLGVNEVLYALMSDGDKLRELTKLVGQLRFAVEGSDAALVKETEEDLSLLAKQLPDNHHVEQLIEAVKASGERGVRLADLYLQRCYHLVQQEFGKLGENEEEIKSLESGGESP